MELEVVETGPQGDPLLGVKAVIATSFEKLQVKFGRNGCSSSDFQGRSDADSLGLDGTESYDIPVTDDVQALQGKRHGKQV